MYFCHTFENFRFPLSEKNATVYTYGNCLWGTTLEICVHYQLIVSVLEGVDGEVPVGPDQSELDSSVDSGPLHIPAVWGHHLPDAGARG